VKHYYYAQAGLLKEMPAEQKATAAEEKSRHQVSPLTYWQFQRALSSLYSKALRTEPEFDLFIQAQFEQERIRFALGSDELLCKKELHKVLSVIHEALLKDEEMSRDLFENTILCLVLDAHTPVFAVSGDDIRIPILQIQEERGDDEQDGLSVERVSEFILKATRRAKKKGSRIR